MKHPFDEHLDDPLSWRYLIEALIEDVESRAPENTQANAHPEAWATLMKWLRVYGVVGLRSRFKWFLSVEDIEDILMDVIGLLQSVELLEHIKSMKSPQGYIAAMVLNAGHNARRERFRGRAREAAWHHERQSTKNDGAAFEIEDEKDWRIKRLGEVMSELNERERALLRMIYWKSMTPKQIARRLGISLSAVYTRIFRLMHKLRGLF